MMKGALSRIARVLLNVSELRRVPVDPNDVYIHRNHAVNLSRIQEIRRRKGREDWKVKLEPPVNRVLPISRGEVGKLLRAFGAGK